jgi:hypothetical protein
MKRIIKLVLVASSLIVGAIPASAQTPPKACGYVGTATVAKLAKCLDSLTVKAKLWEAQGRPSFADLYAKAPPNGRTVQEYVSSTIAAAGAGSSGGVGPAGPQGPQGIQGPPGSGGGVGNVVEGDLVVRGRICVTVTGGCYPDGGAQIQVINNGGADIMAVSNFNGSWWQSPAKHIGMWSLAPDGGMRILQNMYSRAICTTKYDAGHAYQDCGGPTPDPTVATGAAGFDSQAEWSWNGQKPGQPSLGTQRIVLRTDEGKKQVYLGLWAEGWTFGVRASTVGCKWCENVRWNAPLQ